jgi:hypothetical protein
LRLKPFNLLGNIEGPAELIDLGYWHKCGPIHTMKQMECIN